MMPRRTQIRWCCRSFLLLALCLVASGCTQWKLVRRSQKWEPLEYAHNKEDKVACGLYRTWAEEEWQRMAAEIEVPISEYYQRGFFDGFMDYTYAGGKVSPPPVPPRDFWKTFFRTQEGDVAVAQWRDGFLRGAQLLATKGIAVARPSRPTHKLKTIWIREFPSNRPTRRRVRPGVVRQILTMPWINRRMVQDRTFPPGTVSPTHRRAIPSEMTMRNCCPKSKRCPRPWMCHAAANPRYHHPDR